jgi:isopentenyl-diphosphate delta-isomerase
MASMDEFHDNGSAAASGFSAPGDSLILVDEFDRDVGHLSKEQCHQGGGVLHRAFSLLIFNDQDELLVQQRAASKRLWPLYWSNSCCSHPRRDESMEAAIKRRLSEELGISCPLKFLFKFRYQAQFDATGAEHEMCSVYIGRSTQPPAINRDEILAWRWISPEALQTEMSARGEEEFTPWFRLEWMRVWGEYRAEVLAL